MYLSMNELGNAAITLNNIGALHIELGQFEAAQRSLEQGLKLIEGLQATRAEAILISSLAGVFFHQCDYLKALEQYHRSLALAEQVQELNIKNDVLRMLGYTWLKLGEPAQALPFLRKSLELSWNAQAWPQLMADLLAFAQYFADVEQPIRAKQLLAEVLQHPASKTTTQREGQALLEILPSTSSEPSEHSLETLVQHLLT
jgi:tetratricopeptide (TPR) repeat protein